MQQSSQWSLVDREKEAAVKINSKKTHVAHFSIFCRCKCGKSRTKLLVGSCEHDSCTDVLEAGGKIAFESQEDIGCRYQQEDCGAVRNTVVLQMTAPLLKDKDGLSYRQRTCQSQEHSVPDTLIIFFSVPMFIPSLKFTLHNIENCKLELNPSLRLVVVSKGYSGRDRSPLLILLF